MAARKSVIKRWPVEQRATVPAALGMGGAVYAAGVGLTRGYASSRNGLIGSSKRERLSGLPETRVEAGGAV
jgi:hypothetical protein